MSGFQARWERSMCAARWAVQAAMVTAMPERTVSQGVSSLRWESATYSPTTNSSSITPPNGLPRDSPIRHSPTPTREIERGTLKAGRKEIMPSRCSV